MKFSLKKRQFFILFAVIVVGILYKNSFIQKDNVKRFNISLTNKVKSLDPAVAYNDNSLMVISQSLQPLYQYHYLKRPYEIIPLLAEKLPIVSPDGKTYTIKVKEGIEYHPHSAFKGKKRFVKAVDFVNQIKRLIYPGNNSNGSWGVIERVVGAREFVTKSHKTSTSSFSYGPLLDNEISGVKALDDHTLEIKLIKPDISFIYFLAMTFVVPVPVELIHETSNDLTNILVGTGPFILDKATPETFSFKKFTYYHNEYYPSSGDRYANKHELIASANQKLPFIDEVSFKVSKQANERFEWFQSKQLDLLNVPSKYLPQVIAKASDNGQLKHFSNLSVRWLGFNMRDPLWGKNKNLRLAIAHAIDYEKYIRDIKGGTNYIANSVYSPGIPGYMPGAKRKFVYDLNKSNEYLKKAGYPKGRGLPVIKYTTRSMREDSLIEATFIKEQLLKIGIEVLIEKVEFSDFLKKGRAGKLQFFTDMWIYDYPDAENLIQLLYSKNFPGINKTAFSNRELDRLYEKYTVTNSIDERFVLMKQIESIVDEKLPWIMLSYESSYILKNKKLKNLRKSSIIRNFIKYLKVD